MNYFYKFNKDSEEKKNKEMQMNYFYTFNKKDNAVMITERYVDPIAYNRESLELTIENIKKEPFPTEDTRLRLLRKYQDALTFLLSHLAQNQEPYK